MVESANLHKSIFLRENIYIVKSVKFQILWLYVNSSLSEDAQIA